MNSALAEEIQAAWAWQQVGWRKRLKWFHGFRRYRGRVMRRFHPVREPLPGKTPREQCHALMQAAKMWRQARLRAMKTRRDYMKATGVKRARKPR